jgi:hypothetical protein
LLVKEIASRSTLLLAAGGFIEFERRVFVWSIVQRKHRQLRGIGTLYMKRLPVGAS